MDLPRIPIDLGSSQRIYVAHVNDLNDFFVYSDWSNRQLSSSREEFVPKYLSSSTTLSNFKEFTIGSYCLCPSDDNDWYRAQIRQLDSNGNATIFKVDYGVEQSVSIKHLQQLEPWMYQVPSLILHCSLVNVAKPRNGWTIESIHEFSSSLQKPFLYAKFITYNEITGIYEVEITEKNSNMPLNKDFEQHQTISSIVQKDDQLIYKSIPMEILEFNQLYRTRLLHYINPGRFYIYLSEKQNIYDMLQVNLQTAAKNSPMILSPIRYQPIAAKDNLNLWHRAIILDYHHNDISNINVFLIDIGKNEFVSINDIRELPNEFYFESAFGIPCRLYNVCPIAGNTQTEWKINDTIHEEFKRLMVNKNITCRVRDAQVQECYYVDIVLSTIGDLGGFFIRNNLASKIQQQSSYISNISSQTTSNNGYYWITNVLSAIEFYDVAKYRRGELDHLSKNLKIFYDNLPNYESLNVNVIQNGMLYVVERDNNYYRVVIKSRENNSKFVVKLIDRGDEIVAHASELLQMDKQFSSILPYVTPFSLYGYDESTNSNKITYILKKNLFNKSVYIVHHESKINEFNVVDVTLPGEKETINERILKQNSY